ncbi:MAG: 5'-nucleotidase [Saccharofermentanales bacterium]|jgi:2',3'-cyclic-nucleotide 2'-phosphodiesterase (5'-nucleotidase family)
MSKSLVIFYLTACLFMTFSMPSLADNNVARNDSDVLGKVDDLLTTVGDNDGETSLGNAVADAVRENTSADIVILVRSELNTNLQGGEKVTWGELKTALPGMRQLEIAEVSPTEIKAILETGVSHVVIGKNDCIDHNASIYDEFPQVSGIAFEYDVSAPIGQRITRMTLTDAILDPKDSNTRFRLVTTAGLLPGSKAIGMTLAETVADFITKRGSLSYPVMGRITCYGTVDHRVLGSMPVEVIAAVIIACAILIFLYRKR